MPSGPSSGKAIASLELIATTARPRSWNSVVNRANSFRMCRTNGQWWQMNATSSGRDAYASDDTLSPPADGSVNAGSLVPSGNIVEGVAVIAEPQYSEVAGLQSVVWSG